MEKNPEALGPFTFDALRRGVNVKFLKAIYAHVKKLFRDGTFNANHEFNDGTVLKPAVNFEDVSTTHVVYLWVKEASVTGDSRLVDCPELLSSLGVSQADVGIPTFFVSHAWKGSFNTLIVQTLGALRDVSETETYIWMDMWAVNQTDRTDTAKQQKKADVAAFKMVVKICLGGTIVIVDPKHNPSSRLWCIYE
jgi:hypothetical protein